MTTNVVIFGIEVPRHYAADYLGILVNGLHNRRRSASAKLAEVNLDTEPTKRSLEISNILTEFDDATQKLGRAESIQDAFRREGQVA